MSDEQNKQPEGLLEGYYTNPKLTAEALEAEEKALDEEEAQRAQDLLDAAEAQKAAEEAGEPEGLDKAQQHDYEKRYKDLQRYMSKKDKEHEEEKARLQQQLEDRDVRLPKSAEELEAFRETYPDIYATIETVATLKSNETVKTYEERLKAVEAYEVEVDKKNSLLEVKKTHEDLEEIVTSDEFVDWVNQKTESGSTWIRESAFESTQAGPVIDVISLYKQEKGITAPKKRGRPQKVSDTGEGAAKVSTGRSEEPGTGQEKVYTKADIDKLTDEEFLELDAKGAFASLAS